jgi:general secretion pathway protein G
VGDCDPSHSRSSNSILYETGRFPTQLPGDKKNFITARDDITRLMGALQDYKFSTSSLPTTAQGLAVVRDWLRTSDIRWMQQRWPQGPPIDPWGRPYVYRYPGEHGEQPEIISYGADGQPGGDGPNTDIVSWSIGAPQIR